MNFEPSTYHPFLKKVWGLKNSTSKTNKTTGLMIGDGRFELVFVLGRGYKTLRPTGVELFGEGIYLGGQMDCPLALEVFGHTELITFKLEPWAASVISGFDFKQALNKTVPLRELNPSLHGKLVNIDPRKDIHKILELLSIALADQRSLHRDVKLVQACCQILDSGYVDFKQARDFYLNSSNLSARAIEQKFSRHIGLSPQKYANGIRLRKVSEELTFEPSELSQTALTYKYGFFDQPHFARSFKAYWGFSPKKLFERNTFITNPRETFRYYTM